MPRTTPEFRVPSPVERLFNRIFGFLVGLGLGFPYNYLLQVRGRKSGKIYSTPINLLELPGKRFLVAPRGRTQWVRNPEAAGEVTLKKGSTRQKYRLRPLTPAEKPEILKAYLDAFRREVQRYFPVPAGSPLEAFAKLTESYPASNSSQRDSSPSFLNHSGAAAAEASSLGSYPAHTNTGSLGYFANRASVSASWHMTNTDPRSDCTRRAWRQFVQSPAYPGSIEISPFIHEE
jgi:deazaflavin-dependent oxidoreductase (nitroreductase family)